MFEGICHSKDLSGRAFWLLFLALACVLQLTNAQFCMPTPHSCWPPKTIIAAWVASLTDTTVIQPDRSGDLYLNQAASMNLLKSNFPGLIVIPGTEADLRSAVRFAAKHRIRISLRCSGHDFNGRSTGRGVMLIKTERLRSVMYNSITQTVAFAAGATHEDVYAALVPHKRVFVGAQSKSVCPAGCLAGGCHGLLSRQYGLGIDSVVEIRIALFNGTVLALSRNLNADLFNAYLGAGSNSFGVALSFKAMTYPAPPYILSYSAIFSIPDPNVPYPDASTPNLFSEFFFNIRWFNSLPRELAGSINVNGDAATIKWYYIGNDVGAVQAVLQPLLTSRFVVEVQPVVNYSTLYDASEANYPPVSDLWARKFVTNSFLPPDQRVLDALTKIVFDGLPGNMWLWFVFGGAVQEGTTGSVPAGMRSAMYEALFGTLWFDPNEDQDRMSYVMEFTSSMYGITEASYVNEMTTWGSVYNLIPDWQMRFYSDYDGLLDVKSKYDPCNLFTARFAVGSDLPLATCALDDPGPKKAPLKED